MPTPIADWMTHAHARLIGGANALRRAIHGRDPAVEARLSALREALSAHLAFEEAELGPWYAARPPHPPNATPEIFASDHAKLRKWLDALSVEGAHRDAAVARCDAAAKLAGVLDHHDAREMAWLVPALSSWAGELPPPLPDPDPGVLPGPPAPWADTSGGDALEDLLTALAGGAADLGARSLAAVRSARTPKEEQLAARLGGALAVDDRPAAWDALRLLQTFRAFNADAPAR